MVGMTISVANQIHELTYNGMSETELYNSILRLSEWLEGNGYKGYDTFDGLSAPFLRRLTLENRFLLTALQQGVRRFPVNLRPMLGITKAQSTKGMGFLARGFIRLCEATDDRAWGEKARFCLQWLIEHKLSNYSGACWGNHFDYVSRNGSIPKGVPTVVWTSLIGHAFLDAYEFFRDEEYLEVAVSICEHIIADLRTHSDGDGLCINYTPGVDAWVHNANTLGGCFLARTYGHTKEESYRSLAQKAMTYTAQYQRPDGSWFYGERSNLHWVDNFHTAYVLDCFRHYANGTKDQRFDETLNRGYEFWKRSFFLDDGTPRYYSTRTLPIDIQCSSQAIDTLVMFSDQDPQAIALAANVAKWTIKNMQDKTGYFYYRRYSPWVVNKTPTLHWGQATMFCALAGLYKLRCA
jgi:polysaccharide biosynthesis protein VpsJ